MGLLGWFGVFGLVFGLAVWFAPALLINQSRKVTGVRKTVWGLLSIFGSWFVYLVFRLWDHPSRDPV